MNRKHTNGSALIIGLILLLALTVLGVAGMNGARIELIMAGNSQFFSSAQIAGLSQIDANMDADNIQVGTSVLNQAVDSNLNAAVGTWNSSYIGSGPVPSGGFSLGGQFAAHHYEFGVAISQTGLPLDVRAVQGAYLIGPGT